MPEINDKPIPQQPINGQPNGLKTAPKRSNRRIWLWVSSIAVAVVLGLAAGAVVWYNVQLSSVGSDKGQLIKITIAKDSTLSQISKQLEEQSIIRNSTAFDIYTRLSGKGNGLKAGTYRLSPAETTPQIICHLVNGSVDQFSITFYPGATLTDKTNNSKKYDVTTVLKKAGYSDQEITTALQATYSGPLFEGKPSSADLEGYIYGETYNFNTGATVQDILKRIFDEFYQVVQDNNLVQDFKSHGLDLYQGITLASIVQREINSPQNQNQPTQDQKQAAQVFYSRLGLGISLGSDVTYQYIADKTGVARDPSLDSPYNTRIVVGLPPGPIAVPSLTALMAVAQPATTDYLFFLSGDDNVTHFARTDAEHQANIANYCKIKCSTP
jgi:UPF0755 protein